MNVTAPGTYLLLLECERSAAFCAGKLGRIETVPGFYLYVGSAFGCGGLRARISHHARVAERPHWHIDYLRAVTRLARAWCSEGVRQEHAWAQALMHWQDAAAPFAGFGASDCNCSTHLFYLREEPATATLEDVLDPRRESRIALHSVRATGAQPGST